MKPSRCRSFARFSFNLELGILTLSNIAALSLRIRVSMSAISPVIVVVEFGEDQLVVHTEGVVAVAVEGLGRQSTEVTDTWDGHAQEPVEELPRPVATKGDLDADGLLLAQLEARDRLLRARHDGLLAGDEFEVTLGTLEQRGLLRRATDARVEDDLLEARHLHDVRETELFLQRGTNLFVVTDFETWTSGGAHRTSPHLRQARTFLSSTTLEPIFAGPLCFGHHTATFDAFSGISLSMMPACMVEPDCLVARLAMLRLSRITLLTVGRASSTLARCPRNLTVRTNTSSPL